MNGLKPSSSTHWLAVASVGTRADHSFAWTAGGAVKAFRNPAGKVGVATGERRMLHRPGHPHRITRVGDRGIREARHRHPIRRLR